MARETIVAIATPAGKAALSVVRVSGPDVPRMAVAILGSMPPPRAACLRSFKEADGSILDQGLVLYFPAPASFTGEHVLELQGHGGAIVSDGVVRRVLALGARSARPGEFSERAFLNGKMDLAQAEGIADLIDAGTQAAARAALRSMQGEFSTRIRALESALTELRVHVEAGIDFPEEEIDLLSSSAYLARLSAVCAMFDAVSAAAGQGALLRDGLQVVIAGRPNAGKSSLLNRLVGEEAAIVTSMPGTTRDVLRHHVHLDGLPVHLIDTAGLRSTTDPAEQEGIRRAKSEMQRADRILYVIDAAEGAETADLAMPDFSPAVPITRVVNKIDLTDIPAHIDTSQEITTVFLSVRRGDGLALLRDHLQTSVGYVAADSGALSARRRHLDAVSRAHELTRRAAETLRTARAVELFAEDLRQAQRCLGEITGEFTDDDLLGEIFSSFCIGK